MKLLNQIEKSLLFLGIFLMPLFYLGYFTNFIEFPKIIFILTILIIISFVKLTKIITSDSLSINVSKYDLILISISILFTISSFIATQNKFEAFFNLGNASFVLIGSIFYLFVNQLKAEERKTIPFILVSSSLVMSLFIVANFVGINKLPISTFGSLISTSIFILFSLVILGFEIVTQEKVVNKVASALTSLLLIIGFGLSIYLLLPGKPTSFISLDTKTSWQIAADSIKESPFVGIGPSNYIDAFNKFRPINLNSTPLWNVKYTNSSSLFLTILTESGILAAAFFVLLLYLFIRNFESKNSIHYVVGIMFVSIFLLPITYTFIPFFFILLSLSVNKHRLIENQFNSKLPSILISFPLYSLLIVLSYVLVRVTLGEYYFSKAIREASKTQADSKLVYELANKAVKINRFSDKYHLFLSNVSYTIANNISKNEKLTDQDKKIISQLIQQSIAEAKAGVSLNQTRSSNWQNLGQIYSGMIPYAKGSEVFAEEAFKQAIFRDPLNPTLRVSLGGIYYMQKKYDQAIETLKLAVLAKSDFANTHYNLSYAYKGKGDITKAKDEMNIVLQLLGKDSQNYQQALKELESMEELTKPEEKPTPVEPQVELPKE